MNAACTRPRRAQAHRDRPPLVLSLRAQRETRGRGAARRGLRRARDLPARSRRSRARRHRRHPRPPSSRRPPARQDPPLSVGVQRVLRARVAEARRASQPAPLRGRPGEHDARLPRVRGALSRSSPVRASCCICTNPSRSCSRPCSRGAGTRRSLSTLVTRRGADVDRVRRSLPHRHRRDEAQLRRAAARTPTRSPSSSTCPTTATSGSSATSTCAGRSTRSKREERARGVFRVLTHGSIEERYGFDTIVRAVATRRRACRGSSSVSWAAATPARVLGAVRRSSA